MSFGNEQPNQGNLFQNFEEQAMNSWQLMFATPTSFEQEFLGSNVVVEQIDFPPIADFNGNMSNSSSLMTLGGPTLASEGSSAGTGSESILMEIRRLAATPSPMTMSPSPPPTLIKIQPAPEKGTRYKWKLDETDPGLTKKEQDSIRKAKECRLRRVKNAEIQKEKDQKIASLQKTSDQIAEEIKELELYEKRLLERYKTHDGGK